MKLWALFFFNLSGVCGIAQTSVVIPAGSGIYIGPLNPVGIFSPVINNGNIGLQKNGNIYFLGKTWTNGVGSVLSDSSFIKNNYDGGTVTFMQPNSVYGNLGRQMLNSGYTDSNSRGPLFSRVILDNASGVSLGSDIGILNSVKFTKGNIFLNGHAASVGDDTNKGSITGYGPTSFFVTAASIGGGQLKIRSVPGSGSALFPIGTAAGNFAPVDIFNKGQKTDFYAGAFDQVYRYAITGSAVPDSIVNMTWMIGRTGNIFTTADITLTHNEYYELPYYKLYHKKGFISVFGAPGWDQSPLSTTLNTEFNSHTRSLVFGSAGPLYLTKKVLANIVDFDIPNVFSPNGDGINDTWVITKLRSYPNCTVEIFNRYGQLMYRSVGYQIPWDGTYHSKPLPVATYYYIIDLGNGERRSGGVTILR